ncbi:MAG: hypothetical protein JRJ04_04255 [Deltaproteobacteria bacterium]|nr:hypothetical protein [Deltaproteobacteria bacterium]
MRKIKITAGDVTATGILNDSATADAIWNALPISARANTWGDEIYFEIPVKAEEEKDATDLVDLGTLAYWPPGNAFCIFFGPTPASRGEEIRAATAVNLVGKIEGDATVFKKVTGGSAVTIEKA